MGVSVKVKREMLKIFISKSKCKYYNGDNNNNNGDLTVVITRMVTSVNVIGMTGMLKIFNVKSKCNIEC